MSKFNVFTSSLLVVSLTGQAYTETCRNKLSGIYKTDDRINLVYNRENEYTMTVLDHNWNVIERNKKIASFKQDPLLSPLNIRNPVVINPAPAFGQSVIIPAPSLNARPRGNLIGHGLSFFSDEDGDLVGVNVAGSELTFTYFRKRVESDGEEHFKHKGNLAIKCNGIDIKPSDIVTAAGNINSTHAWIAIKHESESDGQVRTGLMELTLNSYENTCHYHSFRRIIDDVHAFHLFGEGEDVLLVYHDSFMTITRKELKSGAKSKDRLTFFQCKDFEKQLIGHVLKYTRKDVSTSIWSKWKIAAISAASIVLILSALCIILCLRGCCSFCKCFDSCC